MPPRFRFSSFAYFLLFVLGVALITPSCNATRQSRKSTYKKSPKNSSEDRFRLQLVHTAKKNLGVRYKYAGNTPKTGFDCSGFTKYVFRKEGINLPRTSRDQAKVGKRINLRYVHKGDLIFFGKRGKVNHVAIVSENKKGDIYVIHSTSSKGVKIDNISTSKYWKPRIMFARNILGRDVLARKR
ncbi:MAG TPA: NlpC/P60 family protein [Saprospiraceae bacterium]|nr:NlpC/P60 family protein [Saprospiraceae bacterium]